MSKRILIGVFFVFLFAFVLRIFFLKDLALTFGYDQARDAYHAKEILSGDLKVLGPPASTPGLYHGVFYYYLLAPAYFLGNGSPVIAAGWIALLNSLTVFVIFYLTYLLTKKGWVGLLAAFLFAVSFEATQYATWVSNPTIGVWTVPFIYLGLWAWIDKKRPWGLVAAAIGLGLSIQAEIFLAYHAVPLFLWLFVSRKSFKKKELSFFAIALLLSLSTMIVSEMKFGFKSVEGIKMLMLGAGTSLAYAKSLGDYLVLYLNQIGRIFSFNSYPGNVGYGGAFVVALAVYSLVKKDKVGVFLATWLFSHITVVTLGGVSTPFLMVGIGPAVSIIIAYYLYKWWEAGHKVISFAVLTMVVLGNLLMIFRENPQGATLFAIQKDMLLSKQLSAIDHTYEQANGEPFSINSLTSPLWINTVWTYLYRWYGEPKYGYLPSWHGHNQVGQLDSLPEDTGKEEKYFLILEPMGGIPEQYLELTIGEEEAVSKLLREKSFGELRVQEREKI
ncbi:hypothetical protein HY502_03760 [Candidatus Woesebacteria bacterium]|nr:hypothetical protein [Candidatus Woesebacteria bacterium]